MNTKKRILRVSVVLAILFAGRNLCGAYEFAGGTGQPNDPYQIETAQQLASVGFDPNLADIHFILLKDIDLDPNLPGNRVFDYAVLHFGLPGFTGVFDGNGHTIANLTMQSGKYDTGLSLLNRIWRGGHVRNLGLINVCTTGLGALTTTNEGTVSGCYVTGSVDGAASQWPLVNVGGLVGWNEGIITDCYSACSVTGHDIVGGLVGRNRGVIQNCYAVGPVEGARSFSGLVGWGMGGTIRDSYYLASQYPEIRGESGTPLTDEQLCRRESFVGWDFVGEIDNGMDDIWCICEGGGFPQLVWQFTVGDFDNDGRTNLKDYADFSIRWGQSADSFWCNDGHDLTLDGVADIEDLSLLCQHWLAGVR